jgi:threonine dehydratase
VLTRSDVDEAAGRITRWVRRTPVLAAGPDRWFKLEYVQHAGSFKARGAFNRVLAARAAGDLSAGIVVASGGNAGIAYAYAAAALSVPATVFVPETAPAVKVAKLRALRATVVQRGTEYAVASEAALAFAAETGAVLGHAYDQPEMAAGAGTIGVELLAQLPDGIDTVVVACGGGGLMAGVAVAVHDKAKVVAVEPYGCPTLHSAIVHGGPIDVAVSGLAADSLGARRVGSIAYEVATRAGVRPVLVTDDDILAARRELWTDYRIVVEAGAAAALAALSSKAYVPEPGERVAIVLCGANTDPADLV